MEAKPKSNISVCYFESIKSSSTSSSSQMNPSSKQLSLDTLVLDTTHLKVLQDSYWNMIIQQGLLDSKDRRTPVYLQKGMENKNVSYPYSAIASIDSIFSISVQISNSGFLISPKHIITCEESYKGPNKMIAENILVTPGRKDEETPFGIFKCVKVWISEGKKLPGWAILELSESIGDYTGWFGLKAYQEKDLIDNKVRITGYDLPRIVMKDDSEYVNRMLMTHEDVVTSMRRDLINYKVDTEKGQPGSPILKQEGDDLWVVGMHKTYLKNKEVNSGNLVTEEFINTLNSIIKNS